MDDKKYTSVPDTKAHIKCVGENIDTIIDELELRKEFHDMSKMSSPEVDIFDTYTPKLQEVKYGSDEYKACLKEMTPALKHHYSENRHHPEHFKNGVSDMTLIDLVEMICDWDAAGKRHKDNDIVKSIEMNQKRFNYSDDIKNILINTAKELFK